MILRTIFICFLVLTALPQPVSARDTTAIREKTFNAETFTLRNGMRVVVIPNHRVPVVTHMVWYGVGAADEPWGHSGLAHFLEHIMFKGTKDIPPGEFSRRIKALGGNDNAFTGRDFTAYHQSIAVDNLETVMTMEADRMKNLQLPADDVASEHLVVMEERRQRTDNSPTGIFFEQMMATLFPNHPYGIPVIGWMNELEHITREQMVDFYKTWYVPNNALLIVSGDITAKDLKPLAEKIYGGIPRGEVPDRVWTEVPKLETNVHMQMSSPLIQQPQMVRLYRAPSFKQSREDALALQLLEAIMSHGQNSRLYKSLVVEQKIATDTGLSYSGNALSDSILQVSGTPAEGVSLDTVEQAIDAELRKLIDNGVTDTELQDAVSRLQDAYIYSRDSIAGPAMGFGQALMTGSTIDDLEYWPYDIATVTAAQIQDVAARYLDPSPKRGYPYVTGYILPEPPPQQAAAADAETAE